MQDAFLKGMFDITSGSAAGLIDPQDTPNATMDTDGLLPTFVNTGQQTPMNFLQTMAIITGENFLWSQNYSVAEQDSLVYFMDKYIMDNIPQFASKYGLDKESPKMEAKKYTKIRFPRAETPSQKRTISDRHAQMIHTEPRAPRRANHWLVQAS